MSSSVAVTEGAEESGGQKFPAALFAVQIDVKQIAGVELRLVPGAAVGNDAEGMEHLAVGMLGGLEGQAGERCNWLTMTRSAPLMTKVPCGVIKRQFAHEHLFFLGVLFLLEQEGDVERRAEGHAFAQAFQPVELGLADLVAVKIEDAFAIVAFDGENLGEDRLQALFLRLDGGGVRLEKIPVGIGLQLDQVGRGDDLFDLSEMDAFS